MISPTLLALTTALPLVYAQEETILGVYMYHRHGDRTPKILAPTNLTDLGYQQVYESGQYYRNRYIASDASARISGINSEEVLQSQIEVLAPEDDVLQSSALAFLQALYPPVGEESETLRNGTEIDAPMNGYQIVPIGESETGAGSEDAGWLQSTSDCGNALLSSNEYYSSEEYNNLMESTKDFYESLAPVIDSMFDESERNFDYAYMIFDYINVAMIHNETIPSSDLLTPDTLTRLRTLANNHEWNLAYNSSTPIRAIAGSQLGAEITHYLANSISDAGAHTGSKIGIQFGAYASFAAFFGLAGLADIEEGVGQSFQGVVGYASSMVLEMFTNTTTLDSYPAEEEIYVRFLFHNGTASDSSEPEVYPLFGSDQDALSWADFQAGMDRFSISDTQNWCTSCGNFTGECAAYAPEGDASQGGSDASEGSSDGVSPVVGGVIGAMVTLAVVLGIEGLILLVGGFRVVKKTKVTRVAEAADVKA